MGNTKYRAFVYVDGNKLQLRVELNKYDDKIDEVIVSELKHKLELHANVNIVEDFRQENTIEGEELFMYGDNLLPCSNTHVIKFKIA